MLSTKEKFQLSISLGESHFREFKSAFHGAPGRKTARPVKDVCKDVAEALVAFANADGGEILIGVEDSGEVTGAQCFDSTAVEVITESYKTHVLNSTPLQSVKVSIEEIDGNRIIGFSVPKSTKYIHQSSDGRCVKRNDLETIPISADSIRFDRTEVISREYDRQFVDGATVADLDSELIQITGDSISRGMSAEKCLQYLGLAEYSGPEVGVRLRMGALLLFARDISKWHPRCQVRVMKIAGTVLGAGSDYNVSSDDVVTENVCKIIDKSWDLVRPYLVQTTFHEDARFRSTFMYPENACREALVNAIAHRDYSNEGAGIEIFVYDDRIEIKNPGGLLSTVKIEELKEMRGVHQSRNSYVARTLRELGFMRELGEGMRRIFELMKTSELAPPDIKSIDNSFQLEMHHKTIYSKEENIWLSHFDKFDLSISEKSVILLGRDGALISPQNIIDRAGIVDIEIYRQLLDSLKKKGILHTEVPKPAAKNISRKRRIGIREVPRFKISTDFSPSATEYGTPPKIEKETARAGVEDDMYEVFVGGVGKEIKKGELYEAMVKFGDILRVDLKSQKGYAFVGFAQISSHKKALEAGFVFVRGRKCSIRPARSSLK